MILFPQRLVKMVIHYAKINPGYIIIDDTALPKEYARLIDCLTKVYSTILCKERTGISLVVVLWCNDYISIPIGFRYWYKKHPSLSEYQTKIQLAQELILWCIENSLPFTHFLADGLYFSKEMVDFLNKHNVEFDMKAHSNRSVKINGLKMQLRKHPALKLQRNQRKKTVWGEWYSMSLQFTTLKRKDKNGDFSVIYFVSNYKANPDVHIFRYAQRWEIEKMFRTMKQSLGLGHCAARKSQYQTNHIYAVFWGYAFLQNEKFCKKLQNAEQAKSCLLELKPTRLTMRIDAFSRNF